MTERSRKNGKRETLTKRKEDMLMHNHEHEEEEDWENKKANNADKGR